eukprot:c2447_g1_i2.p2 GENE.c2447_g1_i2~~c2447_g1_i2.p2  ORF type:complete len:125 (+),score=21.15 c2447_g1_i2:568-942(+)
MFKVVRLLLLTEITTPLVHIRWILIKLGFSGQSIFLLSVATLIGFLVFRVANCIYMLVVIGSVGFKPLWESDPVVCVTIWLLVVILLCLNSFWTALMLRKALKVVSGKEAVHVDQDHLLESPQN